MIKRRTKNQSLRLTCPLKRERPLKGVGTIIMISYRKFRGFAVNVFLSAKPWNIVGKLSYAIYIFHYMVIIVWETSLKDSPHIDYFAIAWWMMGVGCATLVVAMIFYLFIEMPIATLWSYVMIEMDFEFRENDIFKISKNSNKTL